MKVALSLPVCAPLPSPLPFQPSEPLPPAVSSAREALAALRMSRLQANGVTTQKRNTRRNYNSAMPCYFQEICWFLDLLMVPVSEEMRRRVEEWERGRGQGKGKGKGKGGDWPNTEAAADEGGAAGGLMTGRDGVRRRSEGREGRQQGREKGGDCVDAERSGEGFAAVGVEVRGKIQRGVQERGSDSHQGDPVPRHQGDLVPRQLHASWQSGPAWEWMCCDGAGVARVLNRLLRSMNLVYKKNVRELRVLDVSFVCAGCECHVCWM